MKKLLIFTVVIFFLTSCEKDVLEPIEPAKTDPTEVQGIKQFMICHVQSDGTYIPKGIDILELNTHIAHGDYVPDRDGDGYTSIGACYGSMNDCDDSNAEVFPYAEEVCGDGIDNNCDGNIDEECAQFPTLITPMDEDLLDNGCLDRSDTISWYFAWENFPGATSYQLYVKHKTSNIPVINRYLSGTSYVYGCFGGYIANQNRKDWYWKVRAKVNGTWTEWSTSRSFDVESLDTDC